MISVSFVPLRATLGGSDGSDLDRMTNRVHITVAWWIFKQLWSFGGSSGGHFSRTGAQTGHHFGTFDHNFGTIIN